MSCSQIDHMSHWISVGKVKDAHGIKGEIYISIFSGDTAWKDQLTSFRLIKDQIENREEERILTIKELRLHKEGLILKVEQIQDRNQAESFKGFLFQIPSELLLSAPGEVIYLREILGFQVSTLQGKKGEIVAFSNNGAQDLLIVLCDGQKYEIPFVNEYIVDLDFVSKKMILDLPSGLMGEDVEG